MHPAAGKRCGLGKLLAEDYRRSSSGHDNVVWLSLSGERVVLCSAQHWAWAQLPCYWQPPAAACAAIPMIIAARCMRIAGVSRAGLRLGPVRSSPVGPSPRRLSPANRSPRRPSRPRFHATRRPRRRGALCRVPANRVGHRSSSRARDDGSRVIRGGRRCFRQLVAVACLRRLDHAAFHARRAAIVA